MVMGGFGRLWEVVGGCEKSVGGCEHSDGGCGRLWKVVGGCGRLFRVVGSLWESVEDQRVRFVRFVLLLLCVFIIFWEVMGRLWAVCLLIFPSLSFTDFVGNLLDLCGGELFFLPSRGGDEARKLREY